MVCGIFLDQGSTGVPCIAGGFLTSEQEGKPFFQVFFFLIEVQLIYNVALISLLKKYSLIWLHGVLVAALKIFHLCWGM